MHNNDLKNRIMRRVYAIWFFKKATGSFAVEIYLFVAILSAAFYNISFFNVMRNAFNSSSSFFTLHEFFLNNFMATDLINEFLIVGAIAMTLILSWELFRKKDSQALESTS